MSIINLYENGSHRNILLPDYQEEGELAVQTNQHLIINNGKGIILDPGGHKVYSKVLAETNSQLGGAELEYIFLSHQDPDIVAALNGWLMTTDADALASKLWARFIPHFGLDRFVADRLKDIEDGGMVINLGGCELWVLPAHFMHSTGNFHLYDPTSKILYSGDLGASLGQDYRETDDLDSHMQYMEGFHKRYMAGNAVLRAWAGMARTLEIDMIAPQHGAMIKGAAVQGFIDWIEELECGIDLMKDQYVVPSNAKRAA